MTAATARILASLLAGAALGLVLPQARAQAPTHASAIPQTAISPTPAPPPPSANPPSRSNAASAATDRWGAEAAAAWDEAQAALAARDWVQAELLLERTLMLAPDHAEALLQLAFVLVQRGRAESAGGLIAALEHDPRTPPAHRARLAELRAALAAATAAADATPRTAATTAAPTARTTLQLSLAASSNPLALTSARELRLTTPGGDLILPLARAAVPGQLWGLGLSHRTAGGLDLDALALRSNAPGARDAWRAALALPLPLALPAPAPAASGAPTPALPLQLQLSAQRALDGSQRHTALASRACAPPPAADETATSSASATACGLGLFEESTGRRGLLLRAAHARNLAPADGLGHAAPIQSLLWAEYETVRHTSQPDLLRLGAQARWSPSAAWQLQALWHWQGDRQGYSPLLAAGAPRRLHTAQLSAQWRLPATVATGTLDLQLSLARRWSNIALFAWQEASVQLRWQRHWGGAGHVSP